MANSRVCSIPDCGKPQHARDLCKNHHKRLLRHGDPLVGGPANGELPRYYREVVLPYEGEECLFWPYGTTAAGYAIMTSMDDGTNLVSRRLCEEVNGPPPTPKHDAAHSCGNGHLGCVTKRHLSWKTRKANLADRLVHGTDFRGSKSPNAKLTEADVIQIRSLSGQYTQRVLAERFGVSQSLIGLIQTGKRWPGPPDPQL